MMKIKKQKNKRSKYKSINSNERALIIQYIEEYKYSTSHVSLITGHKTSTIKAIYQVYKKEGRINKKEKRDKILNITTQVILVVADDTNKSYVKLGEEIKEFKSVNDEDNNVRDSKEKMIKEQLLNKKYQILNSLTKQQAVENFTQEMNTIIQQKALTNEFLIIKQNSDLKCQQKQSLKLSRNKQLEIFSDITEFPLIQNQGFNQQVLKILEEQHRLMRL
ncbi:unnamed protein product [Paramecium primaurelia]|uniref:Uncharacterized protein n=1 Tax=Paramecium primaurelia TaxID=5886 RepID=A0A8S1L9Y5_PARPR|nr:unnamed protein product [Paramecium primaurelia]